MENGLPTKGVLYYSAVLLVLEAKLIVRFGQVLHRLKPDFWLSFCLTKHDFGTSTSSFAFGAVVLIPANKTQVACAQTEDTCGSCVSRALHGVEFKQMKRWEFVEFWQPVQLICNDRGRMNSTTAVYGFSWGQVVQANVQFCPLCGDWGITLNHTEGCAGLWLKFLISVVYQPSLKQTGGWNLCF